MTSQSSLPDADSLPAPTTGSAEPVRGEDQGCGASQTGSKPSTGVSKSRALPVAAPESGRRCRCATDVGRLPAMRVVLADDSVLLREGIARLLADAGFDVVGQAGNADELLLKVRSYTPDVAIVDIRMPPTQTDEGIIAAQEIRRTHPEIGVLVLSHHLESRYAMRLLEEHPGGAGYLLKQRVSNLGVLTDALGRLRDGVGVRLIELGAALVADDTLKRRVVRS